MAMNGTDLLILVNTGTPQTPVYEVVGCQRDASINEASATIDVSCKDSRKQRVLSGRYSSSVSLDALYVPNDSAFQALKTANRDGDLILIARQELGIVEEIASAKIDSMDESFPDQGEATIAIAFTVDGAWEAVAS